MKSFLSLKTSGSFSPALFGGSGRPGDDDAGRFCLSIDTTAYNQLTREASWRWSEQERIGKQDLLQYTGKPGRTVRLEGESHAFFRKGVDAVNDLFDTADQNKPQQLVSGEGDVWAGGW